MKWDKNGWRIFLAYKPPVLTKPVIILKQNDLGTHCHFSYSAVFVMIWYVPDHSSVTSLKQSQTLYGSLWRFVTFWQWNQGEAVLGIFWIPKLKKRSLSDPLRGALKTKQPRAGRIKLGYGGRWVSLHYPRIHLDTWNNKTPVAAHLNGFLLARGPVVAVNNLAKATAVARAVCISGNISPVAILLQNIRLGAKKYNFQSQLECGFSFASPIWKHLKIQIVLSALQL